MQGGSINPKPGGSITRNPPVRGWITLDALQQAIGRNSGYRWSDNKSGKRHASIVLCEQNLCKALVQAMRYTVRTVITKPEKYAKETKEKTLVRQLCFYTSCLHKYVTQKYEDCRGRKGDDQYVFKGDVMGLYEGDTVITSKSKFKDRLKVALNELNKSWGHNQEVASRVDSWIQLFCS